jgi:hypothetical protein
MATKYRLVGGPRNGEIIEYEGNADWWGMGYEGGEYNTIVTMTYENEPPTMYWREPGDPPRAPDWICPDTVDVDDELIEDHVRRLIEAQDGQQG